MHPDEPVLQHMQALIDAWEAAGDRRAIFLSCYSMMTRNMLVEVQAGGFEDNAWVAALLQRFAEYYFVALDAYEHASHTAPLVWRETFGAAGQPSTHVLQNLILGVNAHINYDLVFALADVLRPTWQDLSPEQRQQRYRDHCHVNEIIFQTIDSVQDQVIERYNSTMDLLDRWMGPLDEWLTSKMISAWREQVWQQATQLVELRHAASYQALQQDVEQRSCQRARMILGDAGLAGFLSLL